MCVFVRVCACVCVRVCEWVGGMTAFEVSKIMKYSAAAAAVVTLRFQPPSSYKSHNSSVACAVTHTEYFSSCCWLSQVFASNLYVTRLLKLLLKEASFLSLSNELFDCKFRS